MTLPAQPSARVAALLSKMRASRGRLMFGIDATASRGSTWDLAAQLQAQMFEAAALIGGIDVQLVYYRGVDEVRHTSWFSNAYELAGRMGAIKCMAGTTKIARILRHIRSEHAREKISAAIFVGDACEESSGELYAAAENLGVPLFVFQEGNGEVLNLNQRGELASEHPPQKVETVFRELARLTGGAYGKFDAGAAKQLGEMLRAVAAFATGGLTALANQNTDSARLLLGQLR